MIKISMMYCCFSLSFHISKLVTFELVYGSFSFHSVTGCSVMFCPCLIASDNKSARDGADGFSSCSTESCLACVFPCLLWKERVRTRHAYNIRVTVPPLRILVNICGIYRTDLRNNFSRLCVQGDEKTDKWLYGLCWPLALGQEAIEIEKRRMEYFRTVRAKAARAPFQPPMYEG